MPQPKKNILVTGAGGQLGQAVFRVAVNLHDPSGLQFFFASHDDLDITSRDDIMRYVSDNCIDIIINCAAYTAVDKAEDEPEEARLINAEAVRNLAAVARDRNVFLIHVSTDYVFGGERTNTPYTEDVTPSPTGVYGRTKLQGEEYIRKIAPAYLIIRTAWLYAAYGKNFVKTMLSLMAAHDEVKVVCDQVGTPTHAADLAAALCKIAMQVSEPAFDTRLCGIYNYTDEGVCSWYDFAVAIEELSRAKRGGKVCVVKPCTTADYPTRAKRPAYSVLDKTKIKNTFGVEAPHWRASLKKCIESL